MRVLELFETRYPDFTAKHFHEKLVCEHGFGLSYNWLRLSLQAHGKIKPAPRRGAHRRKRPRRPVVGMMLHQDGSSHEWVAGQWWDLIVTMDDATSEVYSGFFVAEEGTMSTFRGLGEVIAENGLFCSLYADRASHYWHTPEAGGGVDKDNPTQVGRALAQLGIELIAAYSPQARGRSERMFGTCRSACPRSCASPGSPPWPRPIAFSRSSSGRRTTPASPARPRTPARPSWLLPARSRTSSAPRRTASSRMATTPCATRTARCRYRSDRHRHHYVKAQVLRARTSRRPPGRLPRTQVSGALPADGETIDDDRLRRDPLRRDRARACGRSGLLGKAADLTTSPQAQPPQQKRSIHMVHKAVNSVCYRQSQSTSVANTRYDRSM